MKTWIRKSLKVGVLSASLLLFAGQTAAQAGSGQVSDDNDGVLNGVQAMVPIQVPINVCNIGVGVLLAMGVGMGECDNGAAHDVSHSTDVDVDVDHHHKHKGKGKDHRHGYGRELTAAEKLATQTGARERTVTPAREAGESSRTEGAAQVAKDNDGLLNGLQIYVPIQVPINVCNIGVGVLLAMGIGMGECDNGAAHDVSHSHDVDVDADEERGLARSGRTEGAAQVSDDNDGVLNGVQIYVPIQVPINVCNIGVGVLLAMGVGMGECDNGTAHDVSSDHDVDVDVDNGHHHHGHGHGHGHKPYRGDDDLRKANSTAAPSAVPTNGLLGMVPRLTGAAGGATGGKESQPTAGQDTATTKVADEAPATLPASAPAGAPGQSLGGLPVAGLGKSLSTAKMDVAGLQPLELLNKVS